MSETDRPAPDEAAIRAELAKIVTGGLVPKHVGNVADVLLELEIVKAAVPAGVVLDDDAEGDAYDEAITEAIVAVLNRAVSREEITSRKLRKVLKRVLPLRDELLAQSIAKRRAAAAEAIQGAKPIKPSTIRTYYEPRALDLLAKILVRHEALHRNQDRPQR